MSKIDYIVAKYVHFTLGTVAAFLKIVTVRIIFWGVARNGLTIVGAEHLPKDGGYIVISSHQLPITAEVTLCSRVAKRNVVPWAAAQQESATSIRAYWFYRHHSWGIIPMPRVPTTETLHYLAERSEHELKRGNIIWIAPEAQFGYLIGMRRGHHGFIRVLDELRQYPIVPMTAFCDEPCHWHLDLYRRHPSMKVVFGKPFRLSEQHSTRSTRELVGATDEMMLRIAELCPPKLRGYYAPFALGERRYTVDI